jgi:hypothetical protein
MSAEKLSTASVLFEAAQMRTFGQANVQCSMNRGRGEMTILGIRSAVSGITPWRLISRMRDSIRSTGTIAVVFGIRSVPQVVTD